ncbi:MAG: hypothetical protein WC665_01275 [Sulfurimonas sp.]|jgi:uncharacterized protein YoxC
MNENLAKQIVDLQNLSMFWSIGASIASIVLAIVAIVLAVYFYTQAKQSEKDVANSLSKIEAQSQALEKITGRQVERLTKHITERKGLDEIHPDLKIIADMASTFKQSNNKIQNFEGNDRLQIVKYMIGAYYYCSVANYYAFMSLPEASNFDEKNNFHNRTKHTLDTTSSDVKYIQKQFDTLKITDQEINESGLENLYKETVEAWLPTVKDASSSFVKIEEFKKDA